ncbi:MAG: hypothetical protein L6R40_006837 [Gallowayella cf. fulva]|nr:MAG: hypothetical protein L6R40_006837 [Xanthomendoza cf. fulva]
MAPLTTINTTTFYPLEPLVTSLLNNPTVTPTDKALYLAGIGFTLLCLLIDIGGFAYLAHKLYRIYRPRLPWHTSTNGFEAIPFHEGGTVRYEVEKGFGEGYLDTMLEGKEVVMCYGLEEDKENIPPIHQSVTEEKYSLLAAYGGSVPVRAFFELGNSVVEGMNGCNATCREGTACSGLL